uniref:Golgi to ER traffic protein 4 homolog n=1 Tax=Ciona intestinalis TaxID=7719 RepID=F6VKW3_CIOIN
TQNCLKCKMSNNSGGVKRLEEKLRLSIERNDLYEAHQLYNTLFYRYSAKNKHDLARNLLYKGALHLFEHEETGSAAHLCLLYLESLENNVHEVTTELAEILGKMHHELPKEIPELETFENRAITWSAGCTGMPRFGSKDLRFKFAMNYWEEKMFRDSRQHFLYSDDGQKFGEMLKEFVILCGRPEEIDLFLTQAVLQLLCIKCEKAAEDMFNTYTKIISKISPGPPYNYPIINFLFFLLRAVKERRLILFTILCDNYQPSLKKDASFLKYLEKIGEIYFDVPAVQSKPGFFENLMQNLFVNDDSDVTEGSKGQGSNMLVE